MTASWQPPQAWENRPVGVLGGDVLGRRIATCWAAGGWLVRICDPSANQRDQAIQYMNREMGKYTALTQRYPGTFEAVEDLPTAVKDCWLVIEAVPEKLDIKLSTYADLEKYAPQDCILASNSDSYKSGELIERVSNETKKRILSTRYMMPPEALVVELMTDGSTHEEIFPFLMARHKEAGTYPLRVLKESPGFVYNRIWAAINREVLAILSEGIATPESIDGAFMAVQGAKKGLCHMMDEVGLDVVEYIESHYVKQRGLPRTHLDWLQRSYLDHGRLGTRSDKGGLFGIPPAGTRTQLFVLNIGLGEPFRKSKPLTDIMTRGQVLSLMVGEGREAIELVGSDHMPDGIDICHANNRIYWTDMGVPDANDGSVHSANLDGSDVQVVVPPGAIHTGKQLTIDQDDRKIYLSDREGLRVCRVNLDGSGLEVLVQTGDWEKEPEKAKDQRNWPVGIAVSRKLGKFFWTQKGFSKAGQGRIFCANLEMPKGATPSNRPDIEVVQDGLPEPIDLELDDDAGVLYWTDRGELPLGNTLNKKHIVGPVPEVEQALGHQILAQGLGEGIGLRLDKERNVIYVADFAGRIWACNPDVPSLKEKIYEGPTSAFSGLAFRRV